MITRAEALFVRELVASFPASVRAHLRGITATFRDRPTAEDLARGCAPDARGYFYGTPKGLAESDEDTTAIPEELEAAGEIVIFRANFPGGMDGRELRKVLEHEIAHALGVEEEEEMRLIGLGAS